MRRLIPGVAVSWKDEHCVVLDLDGLTHALIRAVRSQTTHRALITELIPLRGESPTRNLHDVPDAEWLKALHLFDALRPLIETPKHKRKSEDVLLAAQRLNKSRQSVYNYLQTWEKTGRLSAFIKKQRKDKGRSRLGGDVSGIIESVIETEYKKPERLSIAGTAELIGMACAEAGVSAPSVSTVRRIVLNQPERDVMKARYGSKAARERFEPLKGSFPGADFPLGKVCTT